jgi:hypothetical protein
LRTGSTYSRSCRRIWLVAAVAIAVVVVVEPRIAAAESLLDFFFGAFQRQPPKTFPRTNFFADPTGLNQQPAQPPRPVASAGTGPAFCVRGCDGRYFPLTARGGATPAQMCQAFCPASPTKVFFGGSIDGASSGSGERYADSENAFAYRKALRPDCTCNGREPAGLAPIDLTLDPSLRPGDVIATTSGLVAYSGIKAGTGDSAEFTPVASYPGLTTEVRARLGEIKVAPVAAETVARDAPLPEVGRDATLPATAVPKPAASRDKRAETDQSIFGSD